MRTHAPATHVVRRTLFIAGLVGLLTPLAARAGTMRTVDFDIAVERPTITHHFQGTAAIDDSSLDGRGKEILRLDDGLTDVSFRFYRHDYTGDMLRGARAVFVNGDFRGLVFKFENLNNGKLYRVKHHKFQLVPHAKSLGYTSFALFNLASAEGDVAAAGAAPVVDADSIVAAPTPMAASSGLALLASMVFVRRRRRNP